MSPFYIKTCHRIEIFVSFISLLAVFLRFQEIKKKYFPIKNFCPMSADVAQPFYSKIKLKPFVLLMICSYFVLFFGDTNCCLVFFVDWGIDLCGFWTVVIIIWRSFLRFMIVCWGNWKAITKWPIVLLTHNILYESLAKQICGRSLSRAAGWSGPLPSDSAIPARRRI